MVVFDGRMKANGDDDGRRDDLGTACVGDGFCIHMSMVCDDICAVVGMFRLSNGCGFRCDTSWVLDGVDGAFDIERLC